MASRLGVTVLLAAIAACGSAESPPAPAGPSTIAESSPSPEETTMLVTSTAFADGAMIPVRYTCDGDDVSPALTLSAVPDDAESLVLIMDDPDAPGGTWDHWVAFDIPVTETIPEDVGPLGVDGRNSWGRTGYGGPCPPSGTHRYVFQVIAVSGTLGLEPGATKVEVLDAVESVELAAATLTGRYTR